MPFISIIIPCYNQAHYLADCLNSILAQSYRDWEAIVVNDGSSDNTESVAKYFSGQDNRIQYIRKYNAGLSSARNTGLTLASGQYVMFLDADDWILSGLLQMIYDSQPFEWLHFGYSHFTNNGKININTYQPATCIKTTLPHILQQNIGPVHSFVIKRDILQQVGYFDESLKSAEDWDFWLRVAKAGLFLNQISFVGAAYRLAENSMSRNAPRMFDAVKNVAFRAVKKDSRLPLDLPDNRDYPELDVRLGIQHSLAMCLGVAVMQGRLDEAITLYHKETSELSLFWSPENFEPMCSYLSFRYRYSKEDINWIFLDIYPIFTLFFQRLNFDKQKQKDCLKKVFYRHIRVQKKFKYGILASLINRFYD